MRCSCAGTCRWGEFGEGGLLWAECSSRHFEWFEGDPVKALLVKVDRFLEHSFLKQTFELIHYICFLILRSILLIYFIHRQVKELYGLDDSIAFRSIAISSEKRPRPLHLGTATQIG